MFPSPTRGVRGTVRSLGDVDGLVFERFEQEQLDEQQRRGVEDGAVGEAAALDESPQDRGGDRSGRKRGVRTSMSLLPPLPLPIFSLPSRAGFKVRIRAVLEYETGGVIGGIYAFHN